MYCSIRAKLQPNTVYRYCTCGRTASPNRWECDDSCGVDDPKPLEFSTSSEQSNFTLCGCRYASKLPWCDGSHIHVHDSREDLLHARRMAEEESQQQQQQQQHQ